MEAWDNARREWGKDRDGGIRGRGRQVMKERREWGEDTTVQSRCTEGMPGRALGGHKANNLAERGKRRVYVLRLLLQAVVARGVEALRACQINEMQLANRHRLLFRLLGVGLTKPRLNGAHRIEANLGERLVSPK